MNYRTRHLVALVQMPYMGLDLQPGDPFHATPVDADYLMRCQRAKEYGDGTTSVAAYVPQAPAPAPAPTIAPSPTPAPTEAPTEAPAPAPISAPAAAKLSEGLTVAEIKAKLAEKNIEIPDGVTLKADLAALLDAAA